MADQEFLASYAVDIDEQGVDRLQSILDSNRSLAESLSAAFQAAYVDLSEFVRQATLSVTGFSQFESAQERATGQALEAEQAIRALTGAYSGLTAAIPSDSLDLSLTGVTNASGVFQSISAGIPHLLDALRTGADPQIVDLDNSSERNESGRKTSEFSGFLTEISASVGRMVTLLAGSDNDTDSGSSSGRGSVAAGGGSADLMLDLSGAGESLQSFLQSLTASEAEIPAGLNMTGAEEELSASARSSLLLGISGSGMDALQSLPDYMAAAQISAGAVTMQNNMTRTVEAPVNINVNASGTDARELGQSVYDAAQRYLVRTLQRTI